MVLPGACVAQGLVAELKQGVAEEASYRRMDSQLHEFKAKLSSSRDALNKALLQTDRRLKADDRSEPPFFVNLKCACACACLPVCVCVCVCMPGCTCACACACACARACACVRGSGGVK